MHERFTLCKLTIEMDAEYGVIAPDDTTIAYFRDARTRPGENTGSFDRAL
jgi:homoaconitase/3-isopropylmalate dehydratase large subunit